MQSLRISGWAERRSSKRHAVRLPASISVANDSAGGGPLTVSAVTRDISTDGLALIIPPSIVVNAPELTVPGNELRVWVALPFEDVGVAEIKVVLTQAARPAGELGYLIGVRIKEMKPAESARYNEFICDLSF